MDNTFQKQLKSYVQQTNLSVRRVAVNAGIPHQTLHNWLNGRRPRWHPELGDDLNRLGATLGLENTEIEQLLQFVGCVPVRTVTTHQENSMNAKHDLPEGWIAAGTHPNSYDMYVDDTVTYDGRPSLILATDQEDVNFGTVMQNFHPDNYVGKRLRYRAVMRTADVDSDDQNWVGLWMRVDNGSSKSTSFDNMQNRSVQGTTDWTEYEIVLDVAEDSKLIAFGMLLGGSGKAWFTNIRFDVVGDDVPVTDLYTGDYEMGYEPVNLFSGE